MKNSKYNTLINILDGIIKESPDGFKSINQLDQKRSRAFIHIYLKAKYGILDFKEREKFICDNTGDGGLDAYYINKDTKEIFFIQSKFGATEKNFNKKEIILTDLLKMDIDRIMTGEQTDSSNNPFNNKVINFQKEIQKIENISEYKKIVIILANLKKINENQLKKIIGNYKYEIFDFEKSYKQLVFLLCSGNYPDPKGIIIKIDLNNKEKEFFSKQNINTESGKCKIAIVFVPTKEIGRILYEYKNSILKNNPRNYLSFSKNKINKKIKESITKLQTDDFAILNNGITILAKNFNGPTDETGNLKTGQIVIYEPQIINGGQTAYTLSEIYKENPELLSNKEVMLKIVSLENIDNKNSLKFIETISRATNEQTAVKESDRRSNDEQQINLQDLLFDKFGYFYERKKGEFFDGQKNKYFEKDKLIERSKLTQSFLAFNGDASGARGSIEKNFEGEKLYKFLNITKYKEIFVAYNILLELDKIGKKRNERNKLESKYGFNLQYGKVAIIAAIGIKNNKDLLNWKTIEDLEEIITKEIRLVLNEWKNFEKYAKRQKENKQYVKNKKLDKDNYYKGRTLNKDINDFFKRLNPRR